MKRFFSYKKYSFEVPEILTLYQYKCLKNIFSQSQKKGLDTNSNKIEYLQLQIRTILSVMTFILFFLLFLLAENGHTITILNLLGANLALIMSYNGYQSLRSYISSTKKIKTYFARLNKLIAQSSNYEEFCTFYKFMVWT